MAVEISAGAVKSLLRPSWFSSYGLLAAAALLFAGSLVLSFQKLQQQHEIELQDFSMSFWLASQADYGRFADRFVIRRTSAAFWQASDALAAAYKQWSPLEAGLFDYNRLDSR